MKLGSCYGGESLRSGEGGKGRKEQLLMLSLSSDSFLFSLSVLVLQVN